MHYFLPNDEASDGAALEGLNAQVTQLYQTEMFEGLERSRTYNRFKAAAQVNSHLSDNFEGKVPTISSGRVQR